MLFLASRHRLAATAPGGRLGQRARAGVWTLAALFLWATLAPAISRTLDHGTPLAQRGWVQVCSARGMSWVPAAQGQGDGGMAPASLLHHLDACSLCVLATDRGTPPPSFEGWGLWAFAHPPCPVWGGQALPAAPACAPCARGPPVST